MAEEAVIRIVVVDEGARESGGSYVPPEPSGGSDGPSHVESATTMLVASARAMRLAVDTLTNDISRASITLRQLVGPARASTSSSAPLALTYQPGPTDAPRLARTPYQKLQELHANEAAGTLTTPFQQQFDKIIADMGLTKREKQVFDDVFLLGKSGTEFDVTKGRIGQVKDQILNKFGIPRQKQDKTAAPKLSPHAKFAAEYEAFANPQQAESVEPVYATILDRLEAEGREQAGRDQLSAGSNIEFNREPVEGIHTSKVPGRDKLVKKFTAAWLKSKKGSDEQSSIGAALNALTQQEIDPDTIKFARGALKEGDLGAALQAVLGGPHADEPHFASGGRELGDEWIPEAWMKESDFDMPEGHGDEPTSHDLGWSPSAVHQVIKPFGASFEPEAHYAEGGWFDVAKKHFPSLEKNMSGLARGDSHGRQIAFDQYTVDEEAAESSGRGDLLGKTFVSPDFWWKGGGDEFGQQKEPDASTFGFIKTLYACVKELRAEGYGIGATGTDDAKQLAYDKMLTKAGMRQVVPGSHMFYASGGRVDMSRGGTMPNTGIAASGADWHPAWLTNREYVVNQQSSERNRGALEAANSNPDVKLIPHLAKGNYFNPIANALNQINDLTSTPGQRGRPAPGGVGPPSPGIVGTPGAIPGDIIAVANIIGGPIGQAAAVGVALIGHLQHEFQQSLVASTTTIGEWTRGLADPDANPSKLFSGAGDLITSGGEKLSKGLNMAISPITSMLGLDLFPHLKILTGVTGEAAKQFSALMDAIDATSKRYGEYSPDIAVAQAMVEVQHTMGELRRAQEGGPELAKYLRAQGDLQQRVEDIKIKLLNKILPLVTAIVAITEKVMPVGENIVDAIGALLSPIVEAVQAVNRIAGAAENANRDEIADPTELLFQNPGAVVGQGIGVPPL